MHALVIAAAAEELGACTKFIQALDFPLKARSSMAIPGSGAVTFSFRSDHEDKLIENGAFPRNVWVRRIPDVTVHPDLEQEDRRFARTESIVYVKSVLHLLKAQGSRLVNDPSSAAAADIKPLQLHAARQCGLAVPDTLISNSIEDVRTFVEQQESCIVKSARPFQWGPAGDQARRSNCTAVVNPASTIPAPDPRLGIRHLTTKIMRRTDYVNFFNQHGKYSQ